MGKKHRRAAARKQAADRLAQSTTQGTTRTRSKAVVVKSGMPHYGTQGYRNWLEDQWGDGGNWHYGGGGQDRFFAAVEKALKKVTPPDEDDGVININDERKAG